MISLASEIGGERRWRQMGARSVVEAQGFLWNMMRQHIGINVVRECAKLKRERLGAVLGNAYFAHGRRNKNARFHERVRAAYWNWAYGARFDR